MNDFYFANDFDLPPGASTRRYTTRLSVVGEPRDVDALAHRVNHATIVSDAEIRALFGAGNICQVDVMRLGIFVIAIHSYHDVSGQVEALARANDNLRIDAAIIDSVKVGVARYAAFGEGVAILPWHEVRDYGSSSGRFELSLVVEADDSIIDEIEATINHTVEAIVNAEAVDTSPLVSALRCLLDAHSRKGRFIHASFTWDDEAWEPRELVAQIAAEFPRAAIRFELVAVGLPRVQIAIYEGGVQASGWTPILAADQQHARHAWMNREPPKPGALVFRAVSMTMLQLGRVMPSLDGVGYDVVPVDDTVRVSGREATSSFCEDSEHEEPPF